MQDRVSANPGRVLITPESGDAYYATIERADNPTVVGTPLNKANLLTDATAADYGLTSSATPNTMFQALKTNHRPWRVGDILETARTDLGSDWLLCNGAYVDQSDYPALYNLLPKVSSITKTANLTQVYCCAQANGCWVIGGQNSSNRPAIAYTTDPINGSWTVKTFSGGGSSGSVRSILYENGYWVIGGSDGGSGTYNACIWYSQSLTGSFTTKIIYENTKTVVFGGLCYGGGYWAAVIKRYYSNNWPMIVLYATDLTADTWTAKTIDSDVESGTPLIAYGNNTWVVSYSETHVIAAFYTTSLSGTWTNKQLAGNNLLTEDYLAQCMVYKNGYFVIGGYYSSNEDREEMPIILRASSPSGTWTRRNGQSMPQSSNGSGCCVSYIDVVDGDWVLAGLYNNKFGYSILSSLTSSSKFSFTTFTSDLTNRNYQCVFMPYDDLVLFAYRLNNSSTTTTLRSIPTETNFTSQLPIISVSNARAYIRAEE